MLGQRRRLWASIDQTLGQRLVFVGLLVFSNNVTRVSVVIIFILFILFLNEAIA